MSNVGVNDLGSLL